MIPLLSTHSPQLRKDSSGRLSISDNSVLWLWKNGNETVTEHTAAIRSGQRYPSYSEAVTNLTSDTEDRQALTIICSSRVDLTSSLQSKDQHYISPQQIADNKARTVEFGIEISEQLWLEFSQLTDLFMVLL